ncbi:hypothetical protein Tco_0240693 [Tanacetum coccineum]
MPNAMTTASLPKQAVAYACCRNSGLSKQRNTMAEQNVPAQPPTRTDEQIVPRSQWLTIGKSNLLFNAQKIQRNPIFQILVDILRKTSGSDKPRHPVLQMWGIVTQTNVDHAELIWEDNNNIHRRPDSAVHHIGDDYILGNLKFVPKGESVEVFGMAIPDPLITEAIQQSSYYPKYLQMVAENTKKTPQESASVQPATKRATPKKPTTTTPVKQSKPAPPPTKKPSKRKLPQKIRKGKPTFQLVDEEDEARQDDDPDLDLAKKLSLEAHQEKGEEEGNDADLERAIKLSLDPVFLPQGRAPVGGVTIRDPVSETTSKLHEVVGKGKAVVSEEQVAHSLIDMSKKKRTTNQFILVRRDQTPPDSTTGPSSQPEDDTSEKVIHESSSTSDSERTESETETAAPKGDKDQGEVDSSTVTSGVSIPVSVPEKAHEALACQPKDDQERNLKVREEYPDSTTIHLIQVINITSIPPVIAPFTGGTKLDDALFKVLERYTADLIEKYSVLPGPESVKNQESEKSPKEIIRAKKEQDEEEQDSLTPIRLPWIRKLQQLKDQQRKRDSDDDKNDDDDEGPFSLDKPG